MANFLRGGTRIYVDPGRPIQPLGHLDADDAEDRPQTPTETNRNDNYLTTLLKLVPAEVIAVYMAIRDSAEQHGSLDVWFFACLAVCFILRAYASQPKTPADDRSFFVRVQWIGVILSCVAFFLWAFSIAPPVGWIPLEQWLASALAALLSILAPLFVPGDSSAPGQ
jgi:hypothetical protein